MIIYCLISVIVINILLLRVEIIFIEYEVLMKTEECKNFKCQKEEKCFSTSIIKRYLKRIKYALSY